MKALDVPIVYKSYELFSKLHSLQKSIPKSERHSLWLRVENLALDILQSLLQAGYVTPEQRIPILIKLSAKLDMLRVFIRLSFDIKIISKKQYIKLQEELDEIGRMLGGWLKSSRSRK
jgi:hypothetical protein